MSDLEKFADEELGRLEANRQEAIKAKGGLPFLEALPVGESRIFLLAEIPKNSEYQGKVRKMFTVRKKLDGEKFGWTVNPQSPLYRDLLQLLKKAPLQIRVIRTGEGKQDTRYTVKAAVEQ